MLTFGVLFKAFDEMSGTMAKIGTKMKGLTASTNDLNAAMEKGEGLRKAAMNLGVVGAALTGAGGVIAAPLVEGLKGYEDLQEGIDNVAASTRGLTAAARDNLEKWGQTQDVINGFSARNMIDSLYQATSAGLQLDQAMAAASEASLAARATKGDPIESTRVLTTLMLNFSDATKFASSNATILSDKLVAIQTTGKWASLEELNTAVSYASQITKTYKINVDQMFGALSAFASVGYDGSRAGTAYAEVVTQLAKAHDKLGIALIKNTAGGLDLNATIAEIGERFKNLSAIDLGAMLSRDFGQRAGPALAALVMQQRQLKTYTDASASSAGATQKAFAEFAKHGTLAFSQLHEAISNVSDSIGGALAPYIEKLVPDLTALAGRIQHFAENHPMLTKIAVSFAAISASVLLVGGGLALAGAALLGFASFAPVIGLVSLPILGIVAAVAVLAAAAYEIYEHWGPITAWFSNQWAQIATLRVRRGLSLPRCLAKSLLSGCPSSSSGVQSSSRHLGLGFSRWPNTRRQWSRASCIKWRAICRVTHPLKLVR